MGELRHLQGRQLTFNVDQHPAAKTHDGGGWLDGEVKISGAIGVDRDLQPGDALTVSIANADGEVVASAEVECAGVAFVPIKHDKTVIGTSRVHKLKVEAVTT